VGEEGLSRKRLNEEKKEWLIWNTTPELHRKGGSSDGFVQGVTALKIEFRRKKGVNGKRKKRGTGRRNSRGGRGKNDTICEFKMITMRKDGILRTPNKIKKGDPQKKKEKKKKPQRRGGGGRKN